MTLHERIRDGLESTAQEVGWQSPLPVETVMRRGRRRRITKTTLWATGITTGLVAVLLVAGPSETYLAEGETLVSTDPVVVEGAMGPAPNFDTSQLGEDLTLRPISDVAAVLQQVEDEDSSTGSFSGAETFRVTLLGETSDGIRVHVSHSLGDELGRTAQKRCVWTSLGGGYCDAEPLEGVAAEPGGLLQPVVGRLPGYTSAGTGDMIWEVAPEASVVMLTIDGDRSWTTPVSQVAVFFTSLVGGESVSTTVFDRDGEIIDRKAFVVEGQDATSSGPACPITVPTDGYVPPEGHPASSPTVGEAWFGSDDLWTSLPVDGAYVWRKSAWWSANFPGGAAEGEPPITVTWERVDIRSDPIVEDRGTNAYTDEEGWFMIAGIDPREPGCWEVTATYKGASLNYVYLQR